MGNEYIEAEKANSEVLQTKTIAIIRQMSVNGEKINFYTVAARAEVSRVFLYKHEKIKKMIVAARVTRMSKADLQREVIRLRLEQNK